MDKRSKAVETRRGRCCSWLARRRRSLSSKLFPLFAQVLLVTTIWFVVKKTCTSLENRDGRTIRAIRSAEDQAISICKYDEYTRGDSLRLEDIISSSGSLEPDDKQKRYFLLADVLAVNAENGIPMLYTAGTPVVIDGLLKGEGGEGAEAGADSGRTGGGDNSEFYYDNSIEEKDLNDNSKSFPKEVDGGNVQNESLMINYSGNDNGNAFLGNAVQGQGGAEGGGGQAYGGVLDAALMGSNNGHNDNIPQGGIAFNQMQNNVGLLLPGGQAAVNNAPVDHALAGQQPQQQQQHQQQIFSHFDLQNGQGRPIQNQPGFQPPPPPPPHNQFNMQGQQPIQHNLNPNNFDARNNNNIMVQQEQVVPGNSVGNHNIMPGQIQRVLPGSVQRSPNEIKAANPINIMQGKNIPVESQGQAQKSLGENNSIYTEGFKERVFRFKTEMYGRPVDGSSDQIPTTYVMNNPARCENVDKIDMLFLINTIPQSNEQRMRIRGTFVKASLFQGFNIAHAFFVGKTSSPNFQANLDQEQEKFNDIVQGEFVDSSETRTTKGLMSFRWATTFCPQAQFIMKIDEDVFVDTQKLLNGLVPAINNVIGQNQNQNPKSMLCFFVQNAPIPRSGPNALDPAIFPKSSRMRPHCKGFAVLMTAATVKSLMAVSVHVPVFQYDELYLFGILPFVAGGIDVYDLGNKRAFHDFGMAVVNCYKDLQDKCQYVATKAFSSRFTSLWELVTARTNPGSQPFQGDPSLWNVKEFQASFYS